MYIVNRHKYSSVKVISEELILATAQLSDTNHEMVLEMKVSIEEFLIEDIEVQVIRAPFEMCHGELDKMQQIIGITIKRGIYKEVSRLIGGTKGCTHLFDLAMEAINAVIQAGFRLKSQRMTVEEKKEMFKRNFDMELKKTCHTYDRLIEGNAPEM